MAFRPRIAQWPCWRGDIEANDIGGFGRKVGSLLSHQDLPNHEVQSCGCAGTAKHIGRRRRPAPRPAEGRSSAQTLAGAALSSSFRSVCRWPSYRSAACRAAACLAALQGHDSIAMPPKADNPRLDANFLGDRPGTAPGRRQQNDPASLQIALQCRR